MAPAGAFFIADNFCLFLVDRANAVDDLQVVVLGEVEHEAIGHGFDLAQAAIDKNSFFAVVVTRADVGGVFHLAFGTKGGHDAAQALSPIAWAKFFALLGEADNDECGRFLICHCFTLRFWAIRPCVGAF